MLTRVGNTFASGPLGDEFVFAHASAPIVISLCIFVIRRPMVADDQLDGNLVALSDNVGRAANNEREARFIPSLCRA